MSSSKLFFFFAVAAILIGAATAHAQAVRVANPDTLEVGGKTWRLWGVDAPEAKEQCDNAGSAWACGEEAGKALAGYLVGRTVECVAKGLVEADPPTAVCTTSDGVDLSDWLARHGWARLAHDAEDYAPAVEEAKRARRGIWIGGATR